MRNTFYLSIPVMIFLLILQAAVLARFRLAGLTPSLVLLAAVSWGLLRGPEEGVVWAFVGGFLLDLFSSGPVGGGILAMMAAVLVVALIQRNFPSSNFFLPLLYGALATAVYLVVYLIVVRITGHPVTGEAIVTLLPLVGINTLAMLPIYWLLARLEQWVNPPRVQIQ